MSYRDTLTHCIDFRVDRVKLMKTDNILDIPEQYGNKLLVMDSKSISQNVSLTQKTVKPIEDDRDCDQACNPLFTILLCI